MKKYPDYKNCSVVIIGMGYVGLPLAVQIARKKNCNLTKSKLCRQVIGFDIKKERINELKENIDKTKEINSSILQSLDNLTYSSDIEDILNSDVYIVTVPTPVDSANIPDLTPLERASEMIGKVFKKSKRKENIPIIIYESTVYPGATEEICIPVIESNSSLKCNRDFVCGYSPERINPGDKKHQIQDIIKVTSGSNEKAAIWIDNFYGSIIDAGTHMAPNIKVAESAKVIENTQRDLNIALINELSIIFKKLNIDTLDVLEAAGTKWNFLPFRPGLVGGHCIGIDPYYLTYQASKNGYKPQVVLAGRKINDEMFCWICDIIILELSKNKINLISSEILFFGFTFKKNCSDIRNTQVIHLIRKLEEYGCNIDVVDSWANDKDCMTEYSLEVMKEPKNGKKYDAVVLAVDHDFINNLSINSWKKLINENGIFFDLKGIIPRCLDPIRL